MSDIVFVEPCAFYSTNDDVNNAVKLSKEMRGITFTGLIEGPQTHMALYEWIRRFAEGEWGICGNTLLRLRDLEELEIALRELIALDESQMRINCITASHLLRVQCDIQKRERDLTLMEALLNYKLQRVICWERRFASGGGILHGAKESTQQVVQEVMEELRQRVGEVPSPKITSAFEAKREAEDKLQRVQQELMQKTAELESAQAELNAVCYTLNELAEYVQVEARCNDKKRNNHADIQSTEMSTPQEVVYAVQDRVRQLRVRFVGINTHGVCMNAVCGFDPLTAALQKLEETRAECYALRHQLSLGKLHSSTTLVSPLLLEHDAVSSITAESLSVRAVLKKVWMESQHQEVHHAALEEQRQLIMRMRSLVGVRTVLLPLAAEEGAKWYTRRPLSLFAGHSLSLHQWLNPVDIQPTRRAAVFYPLPPNRSGELPHDQLELLLVAKARLSNDPLDIIDLRPAAQSGACLSGGDVRFSTDGRFMYVCCGAADADEARHVSNMQVVEALRRGLRVPSSHCFSYYSSFSSATFSRNRAVSVGWVGAGICGWAVDEMIFTSPVERERFVSHLHETYRTILHLTRAEVQAFAGDCVEVVTCLPKQHTVQRRLVISSQALRALHAETRAKLMEWYGESGCIVPDVSTIERVGGHSVASMMITVVTHDSDTPPPAAFGFLSFSGVGRRKE